MVRRLTRLALAVGATAVLACTGLAASAPPAPAQSAVVEPAGRPLITVERARELADAADKQAALPDPVLAAIGKDNAATARRIERTLGRIGAARHELNGVMDRVIETRRSMAADQERVRLTSSAAGPVTALLARHRNQLPGEREMRLAIAVAQEKSSAAEIARIDLSDEVAALRDPRAIAERLMREKGGSNGATVEQVVSAVLARERDYLLPLLDAESQLAETLAVMEQRQVELARIAVEYRAFIRAQLLWLPSDSPIGTAEAARSWESAGVLVSAAYWQDVLLGLRNSIREFPERWSGTTLLIAILVFYRRALVRKLKQRAQEVGTPSDRFTHTLQCVLWTLLLAAPIPLAMVLFGGLLGAVAEPTLHASSVAAALQDMASLAFLSTLMRELTRTDGLATAHFGWLPSSVQSLRLSARIVGTFAVPLILVSLLALRVNADTTSSAFGRATLMVAFLLLAGVSVRVLKPSTGLFAGIIQRHPKGGIATLRGVWYPLLVAAPVLLAIGCAVGYVVTTLILFRHTVDTYWVILGISMGLSLLERLFQSTSDRFAWRRGLDTEEHRRQAEQVRRMVRLTTTLLLLIGLSAAWSDVVPSLDFMGTSALWTVGGGESGPLKEVTVRNLLVFVVVVVLTVQLVRDLPGVLGLALLQRFPLDTSARYAIVALGRYVLVLAGVGAAFAALKIGWSNVQWLAAAVSVGLGFGLQEIFANFVSGLIMLAERPVRIGDIVTVDSVTGRVINIATRATTLVDADEREIIIPNKQFITTRITNWTLNDTPVRFSVEVGVDYGTDLKLAEELLRTALEGLPLVLSDPAPMVALRAFGQSSIDFDVWYYVSHPRDNLPTRHALIARIDASFRERGIGIAYPQMDLHVRSWPSPPPIGAPAH